eukprot:CAMPEP_0167766302 /NCGR_PEP_ID=MMETSP0110_2-20121227/15261_1 /TAXON_ID=629695 /ORGANISM="Gymnochlora sp., Strain CCMP2014" /LENGTH=74 /DNA_ID=CAMNT_0007654299 /DNA_START=39 /DNA_END=263 /DNA_ORIENTATION=-
MAEKKAPKLDLKQIEKGAALKKAPVTRESAAVSDRTKVIMAITKGSNLKETKKPEEGLSSTAKKAYIDEQKAKK